jgi:hypothetical protein
VLRSIVSVTGVFDQPVRHPQAKTRRIFAVVAVATVLAACGGGNDTTVPTTCPQGDFLAVMNDYVEGSVFIDTPWEPAEGTDLAAAIDAGGVACSYGIQEAEVGATVLWSTADAFDSRRAQWQADGQRQVELTGADEAWLLEEIAGTEQFLWQVNLLVGDAWIQINATFLRDLDAAQPLIAAAIAEVLG